MQSGTVTETSLINKNYVSKIGAPNAVGSWKNDAYIRNGKAVKTIVTTAKNEIKQETKSGTEKPKTTKKVKKKCCVKKKKK